MNFCILSQANQFLVHCQSSPRKIIQCCFVKASVGWVWVYILGHNVNLTPTVDCGQEFVNQCSITQVNLVTEIYLHNPLKTGGRQKKKVYMCINIWKKKREVECLWWGMEGSF